MIALSSGIARLDNGKRFALDLLLDLSCILRYEGEGDVVRLEVVECEAAASLTELLARDWGISVGDGRVTVEAGLLWLVQEVAGASAEQGTDAADRFGRVPASENVLVREQLERTPIVSLIARALAGAVRRAAGRRCVRFISPWPQGRRWAAALSHDLDVVRWWPVFTALRLAELATKGELRQIARVLTAAATTGGRNVIWRGVQSVLEAERRQGVRSSWFILCGTPTAASFRAGDLTYRPENALARRIMDAIRKGGHEIGLHGSFVTSTDPEAFAAQRARLAALTGAPVSGVRQHFLRMRPGVTQRWMAESGFSYDSTFGFADRNGFRLGVADVLPAWDQSAVAPLSLDEAPFTWMDRALSKYAGVERPAAWIDDALLLADACRAAEGLWIGIWHPNLSPPLGYPGAPESYARLVSALVERDAWIAPIGELVTWRRARREARAVAIDARGEVALSTSVPPPPGTRLVIEDGTGRTVETRAGS